MTITSSLKQKNKSYRQQPGKNYFYFIETIMSCLDFPQQEYYSKKLNFKLNNFFFREIKYYAKHIIGF